MIRRLTTRAAPLICCGLLIAGCARTAYSPASIAVTIPAIAPLIESLVGTSAEVVVILPPGASPHAFEPRPSMVRQVARAELLVTIDPEIDGFAPSAGDTPRIVLTSLLQDPPDNRHIWLDPVLMAEVMPALADSLCMLDTLDCDAVSDRLNVAREGLLRLNGEIFERLRPLCEMDWIVSGPFLELFFERFKIREALILEPVEGVEPTSSSIRSAIDRASDGAVVVGQSRLPEQASRMVAVEGRSRLILVDPIGTSDAPLEYATFLTAIADSLLQGPKID